MSTIYTIPSHKKSAITQFPNKLQLYSHISTFYLIHLSFGEGFNEAQHLNILHQNSTIERINSIRIICRKWALSFNLMPAPHVGTWYKLQTSTNVRRTKHHHPHACKCASVFWTVKLHKILLLYNYEYEQSDTLNRYTLRRPNKRGWREGFPPGSEFPWGPEYKFQWKMDNIGGT